MKFPLALSLALLATTCSSFAQSPKKPAVKTVAKPPMKIAKAVPVSPRVKAFAGVWTLLSAAGKELGHTKMKLNPDGTFKFFGPNFGSEGTFIVVDETLVLTYLKSDGKPLKVPGKGVFQLVEDGKAFVVDRYKYGKRPYVPVPVVHPAAVPVPPKP